MTQNLQQKKLQKKRKLSKKQLGFINDYIKTGNGTQSAMKNYDVANAKVAGVIAVENLEKPSIIEAIEVKRKSLRQALIDKGITEDYLADKVNVLLTASDITGKPDFTAIDKGLKHATSIYGVIPEGDKNPTGNTYNFIFSPEVQEEVKIIENRIKDMLLRPKENN